MDPTIYKTVFLIQHEHTKRLSILSAKGQTAGTNIIIDAVLPDTTTSLTASP